MIEPASGWRSIDYRELWEYRDVLYFLVRRDIRVRYTQSVFGVGWAVIQPVFFMIVFSIVFGRLAGVKSDGVPYPIFSFAALVPWTYFSTAFTESTNSLVLNQPMIQKVYFPASGAAAGARHREAGRLRGGVRGAHTADGLVPERAHGVGVHAAVPVAARRHSRVGDRHVANEHGRPVPGREVRPGVRRAAHDVLLACRVPGDADSRPLPA